MSLQVIDVNDEVPWFEDSQYEAVVMENQPAGLSILVVSASDLDIGESTSSYSKKHDSISLSLYYIT